MDLNGQSILVTGAARGIGAATAHGVLEAGGDVIVHARAPSDAMSTLAASLGLAPAQILYEDLSAPGAGARLVARALAVTNRLDSVVNNAGVFLRTGITDPDAAWIDGWATTMAVNLQAPADICRAAVAHFRDKADDGRGGRIVNIASRAGHRGDGPDHGAYAASKGGLLALTKTYARALAGDGIHFYAIAPGWVETRMAPEDIAKRATAADSEIPLKRVAQPEEVAALATFLLTDACVSAVGSTFDVNGASYVR